MHYRNLGHSGLKVSSISLGGWLNLGGFLDDSASIALIKQAFAAGVNLFDVADVYADGAAEIVLGKALKELPREQIVVATKCRVRMWPGPLGEGLSKKHIAHACEASLRRLGVDFIDLYQAHSPDDETPIEETMAALDLLVRQGKVLHIGCSNFSGKQLGAAQKAAGAMGGTKLISSQPRYNMLWPEPEKSLFSATKRLGVGNIVYSPLANGVLTGKYTDGQIPEGSRFTHKLAEPSNRFMQPDMLAKADQLCRIAGDYSMTPAQQALAWCLRRPEVSSVIVGATKPAQLDELLPANELALSREQLDRIDQALTSQPADS